MTISSKNLLGLGGFVWNDSANGNGVQGGGEPGVAGVLVTLKSCSSDSQVATTVSSATGSFSFDGLIPGCYYVEFGVPTGFVASPEHIGSDPSKDSDINAAGVTGPYTLAPGSSDQTIGAGFISASPLATVGQLVWNDVNGNGQQDANEPGLPGVTVTLKTTAGATVATATTDVNGLFAFSNVVPGNYVVEFSTPTGGFIATTPNVGPDATDSDADASGKAYLSVLAGVTQYSVDAGFALPGSLSLFFLSR